MFQDWHHDPWGWPELSYICQREREIAFGHCNATGMQHVDLIDVPKENWGTRPAVVLDTSDRLIYQAIVDRLSLDLIGDLSSTTYGWRLPPVSPERGSYSHNNRQWEWYVGHLNLLSDQQAALCTDIVSFFSSIPANSVLDEIERRTAKGAPTERLCDLLGDFQRTRNRSGIPQRSTASAIIANMYLRPLDDVLVHHAPILHVPLSDITYRGCARWMDDIWLFCPDPASARRAQMEIQSVAQSLGLHLNYAKTEVFEGEDVVSRVLDIEHSAIDGAIVNDENMEPLEELVDRILTEPEKAGRTSINFAATRMRDNSHSYRSNDLLHAAVRMPHAADAWSRVFKENFTSPELQEWYLDYASSNWATHQWSLAHYGRMFTSLERPEADLIQYFSTVVRDANTELPLLAVAAQRLCAWDAEEGRSACRDAHGRASTPHARRVLSLAALGANEQRSTVKRWLDEDRENYPTVKMLEFMNYHPPRITKIFLT
ncbi:hypothetical protein DMA12_11110 [Amycolatopsis balhimycina DSM 5908]|uniref:Reverse transcriptase domain-containing protein n=2 Tax=Amycolatopsis balhimycina TaxID=208443 RepID=A0A428WTE0_AMYBA|nr:hypothetical protein DMA12_11110 [Amycolatopsis balhimycina DSM 5908]